MSPEEWLAKQPAGQKAPLALSPEEWLAQQDEGPKGESGFIPSIKRGGRGLASLATDIIPAMVGKATGNEEYAKKQLAEAAAYQKETERLYPAEIASYKDIGGVGDALTYIKEAIGEAIPSLIPSLITGGVGGIAARGATAAATQAAERIAVQEVTRAAAKNVLTKETLDSIRDAAISAGAKEAQKIAFRSQAAGAFVGSAAQTIPAAYQDIYEATGQQDLGTAIATGSFNAALEAVLPTMLLSKFTKAGISPEAGAAAWYKRAGKGAAKGFVTEGGTEALQEVSTAAAEKFVDDNQEFFSEKNFERFINSGLKGGFGGAGITAATDVAFGKGPEGKKKPAKGQTILDTLAGDEDVARIDEPAGGESTEMVGGPGASPPPGGASGTESSRVVSTKSDAGRLDAGKGQPAAALIAERFDDFKRQYNNLKQEAIEIIQLPSLSPSDERWLKLIQRDLSNVIGANSSLILNSELAQAMKDPTFDASQALQDIQRRIDTTSSSQPRAMAGDLFGGRKNVLDLTNRALSIGRQDAGKAVEYLQGLQQRNQELLPEQSKDSFWGRRTAPLVGMTTAEGFANPGKVAELYNAKQEQEIAEAIRRLQSTGQSRAMKGNLFSGEQTAPNVGTDKPESLSDVFKPAGDAEPSELDLENQAEFDAYRERTEKNAAIERRQSKDKTAVGASITSEERISIATAKKQELEKQLAASQQEIKRLQELSAKYPLAKVQRRATDGTSSTFAVGAAINEEIKILQRIQRDIAGADQQISEAASSVQAPTTRVQPKQPATATVQELPGMETGELGQKKALPVSSENRDKRIELLSERKAAREAKRDEFGAPIEGESVTDQVVAEEADAEISVKQEAAPIVSTEHVAQTKEGSQIKDFFDAIKPVSATPAEQEKHAAPKNAAAGALLEFDIAKPGETTSPGVQAALRYLANRVGGINSFQELLSRLQAAPAELQSGMFKRAGLPDLTTRRGMEQFSSQVQEYLEQLPGTGDSVLYSLKKTGISPFTGKPVPYTEDISQGVGETVEFPPLKSGKPRRPEQRTVEKTYRISDVKLRTAARVLRELLQMGSKLSAQAKAAVSYLQNTNRETFGDVLRDLAFDLAMFELDPRNYGANSTFYGEGGKYARDFRTWIEQNLSADTVDRLDDLIADHKATAEANVVFEKAVSSYRKQLEERAEKLRVDTEKSTGTKIPKAPKKRISQRITETELGEQEENVEPGIPAKNLPRTRKLYEVHPAIKRAIEAGDTKLVLELMAQSKADPYFALLAQRLLDANITAKTELVSADEVSPLSNDPGIPATLDGYLTALRDLVITTLPQNKQAEIVRQLESNKIGELVEAFESINSESGNFTDGQNQLLNDAATFFDEQYNWNGKYDPGTDTIFLRVGTLTNHMFLHEAVHATAEHLLSNPDSLTGIRRQGYDQLNELFNHSKAMLSLKGLTKSTIYGLTNIHEFVSEAMTNPEFQAMLRAIRYKASGYSLMSRFTDGIRKLFKIVDTAESNVLDEVIFATDAMLMGGVAGKELMAGKPRAMAGKRIPVGRPDSKTAIKNMMTSRSWDEVQSQWPIFYSSLKASLRPIALGGLTLNQLGDLVNKRIPQVGNFIRVTEEYLSRKNQILNESGVITKRWERLQVVDPDMSRKLGAVMHRATITEVDPDRATVQQRNDNVDLMTQWTALNPEAKQIYRDVRNFYEKRFSEYKRTLRQRVQLMRKYGVSETTINEIRNEFEKNARKGPYFPLMRYGRFWYQVGKGNDREYYMFETFGELQAHLNERLERNPNLEDSLVQGDQYQKQMDLHARESSFLKAAFNAVDNSSMGDKQGLKDELYQTWLANQPETSFRNRFIHRKAVEGFSQDALRNFSSSSFHMAYQMSRFEYSPELFSQITAARAQIKDRRDDSKRADPEIMRENNELSDYVQELERRMSTILNPEDVGSVVSLLSNVGFIYYLTSVASAATNILGGMVIGLPTLVSHQLRMNPNMSYTAATMASLGQMKNAAMQIMATGFSVDRGPRLRDNYVLFPSLDRSSSLSKMDRAAYNRFVADGVIDITAAYDQSGLASAPTAEYGGMRHRAMQAVSALFHNAERFNREVVAMSAFRTAMEKRAGYKDQQKAFTESIADAKNVTTQSMFDYSSVNKPRYMQSPAARILLQFKQFPQQMTFYLARNLQQSLAGATPEIKREARARFVGTMGMTGIFAGSTGLWGFSSAAAVVNAVMNGLGDDDEEPFDFELEYMNWASETFGKNLGMFMTRGAGNAAGVDLHSRVSLDDMWFRDGRKNTDEATALQEFLVSMLGPTAGIAVNAARAVDLYNQGHADRAIEAVSPGFIKQPLVAARYAREGVNTLKGDPLAQDIGPMDLLMQSLGFRPAEIAEIQYYNITKKGQEQAILKERQNLLNLFGISFMANDSDANEKAFEKIMKFNEKHPSAAIPARSIIKSIKERATKSAKAQHGLHIDKRLQGLIDETYIDRLTEDEE